MRSRIPISSWPPPVGRLMGMIFRTRGSAQIFGVDCRREAVAVKTRVGYLPGELPQCGGLRGSEFVAYLGGLRGGVDATLVRAIAQRLELDLGRRYREYSRGNKQKLGLLVAFMHRPALLILDEPTASLDPLNQQTFYDLLSESRQDGATVFLSSHVLSEVEHVCDHVGIIRRGRLVSIAGLDELHHLRIHHVEIEFAGAPPLDAIKEAEGVTEVRADGSRIRCNVRGGFEPLLTAIAGRGVRNLVSEEPSLEELFLSYYRDEPPLESAAT